MYSISHEKFGFLLTFADPINMDEITHCRLEAVRMLVGLKPGFGLVVDLRKFHGEEVDKEVREDLQEVIELFHRSGVHRSCLVVESNLLTGLYRKRQRESRTKFYERYVNSENNLVWKQKAIQWVTEGVEPDARPEKQGGKSRSRLQE